MNLNLNLNIKKPIVFLKVATTGCKPVDKKGIPGDRIIEISLIKIDTDRTVKTGTRLVNPEMKIPESSSKISGITDDMVAKSPTFKSIASGLFSFIGDADIAGFNISNFDILFLVEEFNRAGIPFTLIGRNIVDMSSIFNIMEKRDFRAALEKFAGKNLSDAPISSETANIESINILNGMVSAYSTDERFKDVQASTLHQHFNKNKKALDAHANIILNDEGRPIFNIGKYKGLLIGDTMIAEPSYYDWCLNISEFPADTILLFKQITEKAKSVKAANLQQNA